MTADTTMFHDFLAENCQHLTRDKFHSFLVVARQAASTDPEVINAVLQAATPRTAAGHLAIVMTDMEHARRDSAHGALVDLHKLAAELRQQTAMGNVLNELMGKMPSGGAPRGAPRGAPQD